MAPEDPCLLVFTSLCSPLSHWIILTSITWKWKCMTSKVKSQKNCSFCLGLFTLKRQVLMSWSLKQLSGEAHVVRNGGFLPIASTNLPAIWMNHLGSGSSSLVKPLDNSSPLVLKTSRWGLRHHKVETRYPCCTLSELRTNKSHVRK